MSIAPEFADPEPVRVRHLRSVRDDGRRPDLPALPDESAWWAAAPLNDGRRDLRALPAGALDALTRHYLPFVLRGLDRYSRVLAVYLGDADDVAGQAALWLLDAMRTYAAGPAPFAGYLAAKLPRWVQDAACAGGRYVAESEYGHARAVRRSLAERGREPTLAEEAAEFGEDEAATAERLRAVRVRQGLRHACDFAMIDVDAVPIAVDGVLWVGLPGPGGDGADTRLLAREEARVLTAALVYAATEDGVPANVRGWWTLLLEHFEGYCRADLERAGHTGRKAIVASQQELLTGARARVIDAG